MWHQTPPHTYTRVSLGRLHVLSACTPWQLNHWTDASLAMLSYDCMSGNINQFIREPPGCWIRPSTHQTPNFTSPVGARKCNTRGQPEEMGEHCGRLLADQGWKRLTKPSVCTLLARLCLCGIEGPQSYRPRGLLFNQGGELPPNHASHP